MTTFHACNPATGEQLEPAFHESSTSDVQRAFEQAASAFTDFGQRAGRDRANLLRQIAGEIETVAIELTERMHAETALPVARCHGERARTIGQLHHIADTIDAGTWIDARIDRADPMRHPAPKPDLRRMLIPLGPVAVFGASNFPLAFGAAGNDVAAALGAGCTVVYKAHPAQPGTSVIVADAIARALHTCHLPPGVFNLLHGWSNHVGLNMVQHPLACAVGFTGSLRGGRALFDAAAARAEPIPVYAEMGSVNPVFVFPSALRDHSVLAQTLGQSVTLGVGQFCTNPGVIVAPRTSQFDNFRDQLAQAIAQAGPGITLYPRLGAAYDQGIARACAAGAVRLATHQGPPGRVQPELLTTDVATFINTRELREEIFGPVSILIAAADAADFEQVAETMEGQLSATIFADETELIEHQLLIRKIARKVGRIICNGVPTGVEVSHAMQHGGPYPAATDARSTSVGSASITRFARPVCYQNFPAAALPPELRDGNPLGIWRLVDGNLSRDAL